MAETPGDKTPSSARKARTSKGPVRAPVLEGTARPAVSEESVVNSAAGAAESDVQPASATTEAATPPVEEIALPRAEKSGAAPVLVAGIAGLVGGIVGIGGAYGLATAGLWPVPQVQPQQVSPDPRLDQFETAFPQLRNATAAVQTELGAASDRIGALEQRLADLPVAAQQQGSDADLAALSARLDDIEAADRSGQQAGAVENGEALAALEDSLASLRGETETTLERLAAAEARIASLTETTSAASSERTTTYRLPLIFSALESAFANGRGFEAELAALRETQPDLAVPAAIAAAASTGLPRPADIVQRLNAVLPDILAGQPAGADASWQDTGVNWFRNIIAMRPAGAVEGDDPGAVVARLETAVAGHDFTAAARELAALPEPMKHAAAPVAADIGLLAQAAAFLAQLRADALTGGSGA